MTGQAGSTTGEPILDDPGGYDPAAAGDGLAGLAARPLTALDKGLTGIRPGAEVTPLELVTAGTTLASPVFGTPFLVLRESALEHNIAAMARFCAGAGVLLAPHAKTSMSPEVFTRQLAAGAWGLTAASPAQAAVFARFGARRVLIANEVTDPAAVDLLTGLLADPAGLELCCYVDSAAGVEALEAGVARAGAALARPVPVLLEWGVPGGRTGVRTRAEAMAVARRAGQSAAVVLIGVSCFEGALSHGAGEEPLAAVADLCAVVRTLGEELASGGFIRHGADGRPAGGPALILSAGGSHYFDVVARELGRSRVPGTRVVLRSGSYVAHDHGLYQSDTPSRRDPALPAFVAAIEVHATVLSRPEPGLALLNAGRRDLPFDAGLPVVLAAPGAGSRADERLRVTGLNDQHAFVSLPPSHPLAAGDRVALGISHPCTAFDKWRHAIIADDHDAVTGIAHTFF
ncbi:MAG TPA: alanine racemase [Trebonia sp.]|jgi:D-serine deaminase-like pyridoxal phosphate-dependent protein|nr:alanine racemase [Trebonia sp.]